MFFVSVCGSKVHSAIFASACNRWCAAKPLSSHLRGSRSVCGSVCVIVMDGPGSVGIKMLPDPMYLSKTHRQWQQSNLKLQIPI